MGCSEGVGGVHLWTGLWGEASLRRSYLSKDLKAEEVSARQSGRKGIAGRGHSRDKGPGVGRSSSKPRN